MWNDAKSLMLSKVCTILAGATVLGVLVFGPRLVDWLIFYSINAHRVHFGLFLATLYSGGALALLLLWWLYKLLRNIGREQVFVQSNVKLLRRISWGCIGGAVIAMASFFYYLPWGIVALAAAFMGLIVRVVKNVIAQAVLLKQESDFTI